MVAKHMVRAYGVYCHGYRCCYYRRWPRAEYKNQAGSPGSARVAGSHLSESTSTAEETLSEFHKECHSSRSLGDKNDPDLWSS